MDDRNSTAARPTLRLGTRLGSERRPQSAAQPELRAGVRSTNGGRRRSANFVGRDLEREDLAAQLERAAGGEPTFVVVSGEAGVGKSRLVAEFLRSLDPRATTYLIGNCPPQLAVDLPYAPIVDAIRDLLRRTAADAPPMTFGPPASRLRRLVPDLPAAPDADSDDLPDELASQLALFEALLGLIEWLARDRTVVLVLEDVQWSDPSSRDWLAYLSRSLRWTKALIVLTCRSDEPTRDSPWARFLGEFVRVDNVFQLDVQALNSAEVEELIGTLLGKPEIWVLSPGSAV